MNDFSKRVLDVVRQIPPGRVSTYGIVAALAGNPGAARAVGTVLHNNPLPGIIPCHRVVSANGGLAPAFAFGGEGAQRALLAAEGVRADEAGHVDLHEYRWPG